MKKILIIEDDKNMQIELVKLLSLAGYEALVLQDFSHSLEEIRKINPDLILLDIQIPEMNGELLLQIMKWMRFYRSVMARMTISLNLIIQLFCCLGLLTFLKEWRIL